MQDYFAGMYVSVSVEVRRGHQTPGTRITDGCEQPHQSSEMVPTALSQSQPKLKRKRGRKKERRKEAGVIAK